MTKETIMDKERLAAFADGELSPEEAAKVVIHLADNPADQAYVDEIMAANHALGRAFSAPMTEPVPKRLRDLILPDEAEGARVLRFLAGRASLSRLIGWGAAGAALAASLAFALFLPGGSTGVSVGPVAASSLLGQALDGAGAGVTRTLEDGSQLMVLASMAATSGYCREFEIVEAEGRAAMFGLACTEGPGWAVDVLLAETLPEALEVGEDYVPAGGNTASVIDLWLDRRGAGSALSPDEEAALIARGWGGRPAAQD